MRLGFTTPPGLSTEQKSQDVALRGIGFKFQWDYLCPWAEVDGHRHHALVYERDDDCFCLRCCHVFRFTTNDEMRDGRIYDIGGTKVVEEIGQAIFPGEPGFRVGPYGKVEREI